jgi:hypothetical protein
VLLLVLTSSTVIAQDLENIGSKTVDKIKNSQLKINGGISANSIFYNSNGRNSREPRSAKSPDFEAHKKKKDK